MTVTLRIQFRHIKALESAMLVFSINSLSIQVAFQILLTQINIYNTVYTCKSSSNCNFRCWALTYRMQTHTDAANTATGKRTTTPQGPQQPFARD
jgi:hypothetical protein